MPAGGMKSATPWREVADEASRQKDPKKLLELTAELLLALEKREQQKHAQHGPRSLARTSA